MKWLVTLKLPEPDGALLREDIEFFKFVTERIAATEDLIESLSAGDKAIEWLSSLPVLPSLTVVRQR